jgi:hypothetical protein
MLPIQAPIQIMPDTIIFFDWPPMFDVMRERDRTKEAWYDPVR